LELEENFSSYFSTHCFWIHIDRKRPERLHFNYSKLCCMDTHGNTKPTRSKFSRERTRHVSNTHV